MRDLVGGAVLGFGVMRMYRDELSVRTRGKGTYEVTGEVEGFVRGSGVREGVVMVFIEHTSASLLITENADPTARADLEEFFERFCPEGTPWFRHTLEGADDMPSHIRAAVTRSSESIPVVGGRLGLGTWQGVFVFEHRREPQVRRLLMTVWG